MIVDTTPCKTLPGRLREICEGTSGLPRWMEIKYIKRWIKERRLPQSMIDESEEARKSERQLRNAQIEASIPKSELHKHAKRVALPGTELKRLLKSLGAEVSSSCSCNSKVAAMNEWGIEGCKKNREVIIGWLRQEKSEWGLGKIVWASIKALVTGLAFRLNPLDPIPCLVDEAIRRAEQYDNAETEPQV